MNKIYVILYENSAPEKNLLPVRGIGSVAFNSADQAMIQAAKLDRKYPEIKHWVEPLKVEHG